MNSGSDEQQLAKIVTGVMSEFGIDPIYGRWITSLVTGAEREMSSCCGNACQPCTLTIDSAVQCARRRLQQVHADRS